MEKLHAIKRALQKHTRGEAGEILELSFLWDAHNADADSIDEAVANLIAEAEEQVELIKQGGAYAGESLDFLENESRRLREAPPRPSLGLVEISIKAESYHKAKKELLLMEVCDLMIARYEALIKDLLAIK